ncbi:MAG: carbamoyltransferase N-terminal domain-containing protein, partial [Gemmatimonadaceae bacterium]
MIVLGFTYWSGSHDSSAAIVRDGMLVAAAEQERFSREKHDGRIPLDAIAYCLDAAGVDMKDVDCIAYPDRPFRTGTDSQLAEMKLSTLSAMVAAVTARRRSLVHKQALDAAVSLGAVPNSGMNPTVAEGFNTIASRFGPLPRIRYYGHHLAHAAAAYLTSGFDDSAVLTMDGRGGPLSAASWRANGETIEKLCEEPYTNSLGWFYRDCTRYLGLGDFGEGKLMGLAAYGRPTVHLDSMKRLIDTVEASWYRYHAAPDAAAAGFTRRDDEEILSGPYADFAASTQHALERGYERAARSALGTSRSQNLCLGGGVALNCAANGKLL